MAEPIGQETHLTTDQIRETATKEETLALVSDSSVLHHLTCLLEAKNRQQKQAHTHIKGI